MTPRRKKGRDERRGGSSRRRKQDLPRLNVRAFWKIGERPPPNFTPVERREWEQRTRFHGVGTMEDAVGLTVLEKERIKHKRR